ANDNYGWLYVAWTFDVQTTDQSINSDQASLLKASGFDHTAVIYGFFTHAVFILACVASVPWLRKNGTITLAFKRASSLPVTVNDEGGAAALEAKNCNYFGNFASRNNRFNFLYPGCLTSSDFCFIDPYINSIWLNNRIQNALLRGLVQSGRVPYNERGYTMIRAWLIDPINQALNNGAIEPGVVLSEAQKSELINEAALDISPELLTQGYYLQIKDPGAGPRNLRQSPLVSLWYTYGGAVQRLEIASTAVI
ncbi:MAG: DUF3383 family protein, partial [Candidatus Adiutrix sp.]